MRLTELNGDLVFLDLGGRLAKLLLRLAEGQPRRTASCSARASPSPSFATMIGASRPAVNRVLHLFAARKLIRVDGQVLLLDLPGLRRRAAS